MTKHLKAEFGSFFSQHDIITYLVFLPYFFFSLRAPITFALKISAGQIKALTYMNWFCGS